MKQNNETMPEVTVCSTNCEVFPTRLKEIIGDESQRSFAQKIGVTEGTLRAWLSVKSEPGMTHLAALAETGGTTMDWLATGKGEMRPESGETIHAEVHRSFPHSGRSGHDDERAISVEVNHTDKSPQTHVREKSPAYGAVNANLLTEIIATLEANLAKRRMRLSPARKALMIQLIYEHYIETGLKEKEDAVNRFINLVE